MTPWTPLRGAVATVALLLAFAPRPSGHTQTPTATRPADLVLRGGKIVTVDETRPEAQAIFLGDWRGFNGAPVTPGFATMGMEARDAHGHHVSMGPR